MNSKDLDNIIKGFEKYGDSVNSNKSFDESFSRLSEVEMTIALIEYEKVYNGLILSDNELKNLVESFISNEKPDLQKAKYCAWMLKTYYGDSKLNELLSLTIEEEDYELSAIVTEFLKIDTMPTK